MALISMAFFSKNVIRAKRRTTYPWAPPQAPKGVLWSSLRASDLRCDRVKKLKQD